MELKINGKTLLGIALLSASITFGDFVSMVDVKSAGGITIEKETMDVGSVVLRIDNKNPSTIYGGTWELITGDAALRFGDGTSQSGSLEGVANNQTVPLPLHSHGIDHNHPSATTNTDTHYHHNIHNNENNYSNTGISSSNYLTVRGYKSGWSNDYAYILRGTSSTPNSARTSSDSHNHSVDLPNYTGNSQSEGVSNASIDVRGQYITVNVWKRTS